MININSGHPWFATLARMLGKKPGEASFTDGNITVERLRASRLVVRFSSPEGHVALVGKFFSQYPAATAGDRSLMTEFCHYLRSPAWGLQSDAAGYLPRFLGWRPVLRLGLILEAVPGPDLDHFLARAAGPEGLDILLPRLSRLARLLAYFHTRLRPGQATASQPARQYLGKLTGQLKGSGLLSPQDEVFLEREGAAWAEHWDRHPDRQVLIHGDATPTNFLFPDGRAVALDLERLRMGDRLWDLSWVAGELKHAWAWRRGDWQGAEGATGHFFRAYFQALPTEPDLIERIYALNPFYMALAELRIARNAYLAWEYRRALVAEALRCLRSGRRDIILGGGGQGPRAPAPSPKPPPPTP